jgi:hypothetical protein
MVSFSPWANAPDMDTEKIKMSMPEKRINLLRISENIKHRRAFLKIYR